MVRAEDPAAGNLNMTGHYPDDCYARQYPEPESTRPDFVRDRARVLHSWALRRLADKTQVLLPGQSDFPRTRLTHTLEVAQIARELGYRLGCDANVTETAGLCHDLGHPPFGHNGESALNTLAEHIGGFEGNAQTLRILTYLEPKVVSDQGRSYGLNLTRATLDATIKYPQPATGSPTDRTSVRTKKFNVYPEDLPAYTWIRHSSLPGVKCFEAQIMDWSDDVAYSVHDVEDALYRGFLTPELLNDPSAISAILPAAQTDSLGTFTADDLHAAVTRLRSMEYWLTRFDGSFADLARLKTLTSALIGRFTTAAITATQETYGFKPRTRYEAHLIIPTPIRAEVAVLKAFASTFVFEREEAVAEYHRQQQIIVDLVTILMNRAEDLVPPLFVDMLRAADTDERRLRVIVDLVSSLTDVSALRWHERLRS